jgi:hypothetical protein
MKSRYVWLICCWLCVLPVLAQEATPDPLWERQAAGVETVTIQTETSEPLLVIAGLTGNGCETPLLTQVQRQGAVVFVEVYQEIVPTLAACPAEAQPFTLEVAAGALLELDADFTLPEYLAVNDQYFRVNIAAIEPVGELPALPPMQLSPLAREEVTLFTFTLTSATSDDEQLAALITGELANGCEAPLLYHLDVVEPNTSVYTLDMFRLLEPAIGCPMMLQPFEVELVLPLPYLGSYTLMVNETTYEHQAEVRPAGATPAAEGAKVLHTITSAQVEVAESFPVQYVLVVEGYQNDGCIYPVEVVQERDGSTIRVTIFRTLPIDVMCSMQIIEYRESIPLVGDFTQQLYTVIVNETTPTTFDGQ